MTMHSDMWKAQSLLISSTAGDAWSTGFYNPMTGAAISSYRCNELQGDSTSQCLCVARQALFLFSQKKHLIHVLGVTAEDNRRQRLILPKSTCCIDVSSSGAFLAAGVEEKLYLWMLGTGKLCSVVSAHYQRIRCVRFTSDEQFLVTGAGDGAVKAWLLSDLLSSEVAGLSASDKDEPFRKWTPHALPVTSIHVATLGADTRIISGSLDQTLKVHSLNSGELVFSASFDSPLSAVTADPGECSYFAGTSDGSIYQINTVHEPALTDRYVSKESSSGAHFLFGTQGGTIRSLSVNMDATLLATGCDDKSAAIWHIASRQKLKTISFAGAVHTCAFQISRLSATSKKSPALPIQSLEHALTGPVNTAVTKLENSGYHLFDDEVEEALKQEALQRDTGTTHELEDLKKANNALYEHALSLIGSGLR